MVAVTSQSCSIGLANGLEQAHIGANSSTEADCCSMAKAVALTITLVFADVTGDLINAGPNDT